MNRKMQYRWTGGCIALAVALYASGAVSDTILFPVIATNAPTVTTIVSVIDRIGGSSHLTYIYRYKDTSVGSEPNLTGTCGAVAFTRPTIGGDIVSFDPSSTFNGGNALFGDTNSYGGSFALGLGPGARRAYLLVTNSNAAGTREDVDDELALSGEAVVMDIATGAAWGMRAINDATREDYTFLNFMDEGGVFSALPTDFFPGRDLAFFPPAEWKTRMFVTPIGASMNAANVAATVGLLPAVRDRQGTLHSFALAPKQVVCTGAVDLDALVDSTTLAAVENVGGWAEFIVFAGDALVYKLEYVVNDPDYGGTVNNGLLFSALDLP